MRADLDDLPRDAPTGLSRFLMQPDPLADAAGLVGLWQEWQVQIVLAGIGARVRPDFGAHLRRSFLAALEPGASEAARARLPCPWDPPCALDVFLRAQCETGSGQSLTKPYAFVFRPRGADLVVSLRVFGVACDWAVAAAEALMAGLRRHLPWDRELHEGAGMPQVLARRMEPVRLVPAFPEGRLRLHFLTPAEVPEDWSLAPDRLGPQLCRLAITRARALARWHALDLAPEALARLGAAADAVRADVSGLKRVRHTSPNRHHEARTEGALSGWIELQGDLEALGPVFQVVERANLGRKANEGLGALILEVPPR